MGKLISEQPFHRIKMPKPKLFTKIFRPRRQQSSDFSEMSDDAKKLWNKNAKIIHSERDVNSNSGPVEDKLNINDLHVLRSDVQHVNETVIDISSELIKAMKDIIRLARDDPSYLKVCFEIIEIQRKHDENAEKEEDFKSVFKRPLGWEHQCFEELRNFPSGRLGDPSNPSGGDGLAICLQKNLTTVSTDLREIRTFVDNYQQEDDYVFRNMVVAYRDHLSRQMDDLCAEPVSDAQMNSILLFLCEFSQRFPKERFVDFWQDEKDELSIINTDKHHNFINRYLELQSTEVQKQLNKCLEIEIKLWLTGKEIESHNIAFRTTQWPVDVTSICSENLNVSQHIGFGAYEKMHSVLLNEVRKTLLPYGCAARYFVNPFKLSPSCPKCPNLALLKKERKTVDVTTVAHRHATHAILNNFSVLHKNLSSLSKQYPLEKTMEGIEELISIVEDQSKECLDYFKKKVFHPVMDTNSEQLLTKAWCADFSITEEFCDVISTSIRALDPAYFSDWQKEVESKVHLAYLNAICTRCKKMQCDSDEKRAKMAMRLSYENRRIGETLGPAMGENYVQLLSQIVAVIESTDVQSCETSVAVLKHEQQKLVTKEHLKAILTLQGRFTSSNKTKKILGTLY